MDIIEFLEENDVDVVIRGKNVAPGWIGLNCVFCDDYSNHLGIRLHDLKVNCWRCGSHSIYSTLHELTGYNTKALKEILKTFDQVQVKAIYEPVAAEVKRIRGLAVPEATSYYDGIPRLHFDYLKKRGFYPHLLAKQFDLSFVTTVGRYKFRIIIPYYYRRKLYSFSARAIHPDMSPPYLHPRKTSVPMSPKELVYNIDNLRQYHDCLAVEGPVDVWKFGDGAVGLSGLMFTKHQLSLLKEKKIRNLFIMFDNDIVKINGRVIRNTAARRRAVELYRLMRHHVGNCEILINEITNDLGEMTVQDVLELKQTITFDEGVD